MTGKSATVLPLRDYRATRRPLYFTRSELNQLLGLYSRNVARAVWRDYAIDHRDGMALFSVFRHTHEIGGLYDRQILFGGCGGIFRAERPPAPARSRSLVEALAYFRSKLTLVPAAGD